MGSTYRQFCPVAKAMELLDERWTLLVVRELMAGSQRFNELRRGVPRMSPSLLSKRLQQLVRAGVIERQGDSGDVRYLLTNAGQELRPVVEALGAWGVRWIPELGEQDLDPHLLLWDMHRNVDRAAVPAGRTVIRFHFPDAPADSRSWWLVITDDAVDVCDIDHGYEVAVTVTSQLRSMVQVWRGDLSWAQAARGGGLQMHGTAEMCRAVPRWFRLSGFASVPRTTS